MVTQAMSFASFRLRSMLVLLVLGVTACSGDRTRIDVAGTPRSYVMKIGPEVGAGPAPLVFVWHGFGGSAKQMLRTLDPAVHWPEAIVVAPEGLPRTLEGAGSGERPGWQIRRGEFGDRDLAFFDALLGRLIAEQPVDLDRIYATGFSNGAFFTNLLGCTRADDLAAIAPVGGGGPLEDACFVSMPVTVVHGSSDVVVPYAVGRTSWDRWREINQCGKRRETQGANCSAATECAAPSVLCSFSGAHVWPAGGSGLVTSFLRQQRRR